MPKPEKQLQNTADIKNLLARANQLEDEFDKIRDEKKDLATEIKAADIDTKAFAMALKQMRKPIDKDLAAKVNSYLQETGQYALFV